MLNYSERLDRTFTRSPTGRGAPWWNALVRSPASVSELAQPFDMSMPAVVQHLKVLEEAGIVTSQKIGRVRTVQLAPDALAVAGDWIGGQRLPAERRLDRLGDLLAADDTTEEN